jgi:hypothetical protein
MIARLTASAGRFSPRGPLGIAAFIESAKFKQDREEEFRDCIEREEHRRR